jgi:hypothetical protein
VFLVEAPLQSPANPGLPRSIFLSAHSRDGWELSLPVLEAIKAWGETSGQEGRGADSSDHPKFGATS